VSAVATPVAPIHGGHIRGALAVRCASFGAAALLAAFEYGRLVPGVPAGRELLAAVAATAGGAVLFATGAVPHARYNYSPAGPEVLARVAKMEAVCKRHGVPLASAALQFPLGHPIVASVIPGAIAAREVEQNLACFRHEIPADLWAELKHEKLMRADAPVPIPD